MDQAVTPDWVVRVKPAGMDSEKEFPELLRQELGGRIYPVHRLDRNVAGLMVYARTQAAAAELSRCVQEGRMIKEYVAICHGTPPEPEGRMEDLLWKDPRQNKVFVVKRLRAGVRPAALTYRVLGPARPEGTLVRVRLETGRSHQIRVQFASRDRETAPALFSCGLRFPWRGEEQRFECLPPWAEGEKKDDGCEAEE